MYTSAALITGASSGIGYELARVMAGKGHDLILVARNRKKLEEIAEELKPMGIKVWVFDADLSLPGAAEILYHKIQEAGLYPEILVNNAGFGDLKLFAEADLGKLQEMIHLNIRALTELSWFFLPEMIKRKKGYILNLGSIASFIPGPGMAVYHATKAYVLAFSTSLAEELRDTGVKVHVLCPGPTTSGFQQAAAMEDSPVVRGKKLPTSAEVARYGYDQLMSGNRVSVPGFSNKMIPLMARLLPSSWVAKVTRKVYNV